MLSTLHRAAVRLAPRRAALVRAAPLAPTLRLLRVAAPVGALRHVRLMSTGAAVPAALVKALRDRTGAGMMDCKAALQANADAATADERMTRAAEWLRKKGIATAQKKSGRLAAQGLVALATDGAAGRNVAIVEINSETDFVARNGRFQQLVGHVALSALALPASAADPVTHLIPAATLGAAPLWNDPARTVNDLLLDSVGAIKENLQLRRAARLSAAAGGGQVFGYVHSQAEAPTDAPAVAPADAAKLGAVQMGRIASIVSLAPAAGAAPPAAETVQALGNDLTMHIVASSPSYLSRATLPAAAVDKERELVRAAALADHAKKAATAVAAGKKAPAEPTGAALDKLVDGRVKKWCQEQVLADQTFVSADNAAGADAVATVLSKAGVDATGFARFAVGEGLNPIGAADK